MFSIVNEKRKLQISNEFKRKIICNMNNFFQSLLKESIVPRKEKKKVNLP